MPEGSIPSIAGMASDADLAKLLAAFTRADDATPVESVAVVGSSGNLRFRGYGALIDSHDVVIRVNGAITRGHELDCGATQAPVVVGFDEGLIDAVQRGTLCRDCGALVIVSASGAHGEFKQARAAHTVKAVGAQAALLTSDWMSRAHASLGNQGRWPSTGFLALTSALVLKRHLGIPRLSVFGYGSCRPCVKYFDCDGSMKAEKGNGPMHAERDGKDGSHAFATEARVRALWASRGEIELHEDDCGEGLAHSRGQYFPPLSPPPPPSLRPPSIPPA